jgi:hypothetical protein
MNGTWIYNWWHSRVPIIVCLSRIHCLVIFYMTTKVLNGNTCQTVKLKMSCILDPVKNVMKWLECHLILDDIHAHEYEMTFKPMNMRWHSNPIIWDGIHAQENETIFQLMNMRWHSNHFITFFTGSNIQDIFIECHLIFMGMNVI